MTTTQSAMRMVEGDHIKNWQASRDSGIFGSLDMAVEDLGFLMKRNRLDSGDHTGKIPSRSGSAPPSMEGSVAALRNLLKQQEGSSSEVLSRAIENYDSEEEIRSDPAYVAYYLSNINLNPRLPPPLISRENQHLLRHFGGVGDNNQSPTTSWDNMGIRSSLHSSRTALSTHREEPEDEASSGEQQAYTSLAGRRKSIADMIQRPHSAGNRPIAQDIHAISSDTSSENTRRLPESDINSVNLLRETDSLSIDAIANEDPFTTDLGSQSSTNVQNERLNARRASHEDNNLSVFGASPPSSVASRMRRNQEDQQSQGRRMPLQYTPSSYQVQASSPQQMTYPRMGGTQDMMQSLPKIATGEVHSTFQSPHGLAPPPMYTSTAAYMTSLSPFYHQNFQSSGMYLPQYNYGSYPPGSGIVPQYMSGYPSHEATVPMPYDISSTSLGYNNTRLLPGVSSSGQNIPSLVDPFQLQYFQQAQVDAYAPPFQSSTDSFGQKDQQAAGYMANHEPLNSPLSPSYGMQSPRHMGNYFAVPPGVRVMPQYPGSPLASPVMPSSPVGGMMSHFGRRSETRYHQQGPSRNTGIYPGGWQGNRGGASSIVDDLKRHSFLDELKSPNARKLELSDIAGRVVEFSVDQHGSRFIQQKLEHCSDEEKASVFSEVLPQASKLMTDVFGNYVIQKFIEHGTPAQREELVKQLAGQMVSLSLQMYGCRVIQKALEVIDVDQKTELIRELDGNVLKCVRDQNGNHVIQKCIESMPAGRIGFVIAAFRGQVATLSTHPYGCRVIQRILEHCSDDEETHCIIDEILESAFALAHDQYGNYVTQHVLERGKPDERRQIIEKLTGNVVQMSRDASRQYNGFYSFDTTTNEWKLLTPVEEGPTPRSFHSMAADEENVYVFGGVSATARLKTLDSYNIADKKWFQCSTPLESLTARGGAGLEVVQGKVWVVYGFNGCEVDDVYYYDPVEDKWTQVETFGVRPSERSVFASAAVGKHIVLFGGEIAMDPLAHAGPGQLTDGTFALDTETLQWERLDKFSEEEETPSSRGWTASTTGTIDGKKGLVMHGGKAPTNDRFDDLFFYGIDSA